MRFLLISTILSVLVVVVSSTYEKLLRTQMHVPFLGARMRHLHVFTVTQVGQAEIINCYIINNMSSIAQHQSFKNVVFLPTLCPKWILHIKKLQSHC